MKAVMVMLLAMGVTIAGSVQAKPQSKEQFGHQLCVGKTADSHVQGKMNGHTVKGHCQATFSADKHNTSACKGRKDGQKVTIKSHGKNIQGVCRVKFQAKS